MEPRGQSTGNGWLQVLALDLTARHGRGFLGPQFATDADLLSWLGNLRDTIGRIGGPGARRAGIIALIDWQTVSAKSIQEGGLALRKGQTPPAESLFALVIPPQSAIPTAAYPGAFPLSWSHYVRLMSVTTPPQVFYEAEAIRGGWSVRQLDRQISSLYERTSHSKRQAAMLAKGQKRLPQDAVSVQDNSAIRTSLSFSTSRMNTARANWKRP